VRLIRVGVVLVNLDRINDTYIGPDQHLERRVSSTFVLSDPVSI